MKQVMYNRELMYTGNFPNIARILSGNYTENLEKKKYFDQHQC